jgi:hypothetical protein
LEAFTHGGGESGIVEIENVLDDVVAKGILNQVEAMGRDLTNKVDLLKTRRMIDAALKYTAAMAMGTNSDAVLAHSIEDELGFDRLKVVQALLNNVVAV